MLRPATLDHEDLFLVVSPVVFETKGVGGIYNLNHFIIVLLKGALQLLSSFSVQLLLLLEWSTLQDVLRVKTKNTTGDVHLDPDDV